ncbi:MAG TPA: nuclear transport factor 2 family protein [Solirubrobacteraceae bacterium]|nr:nuclear transport factor 2 family protein [Solirubrobacteraceae bacterium]
MSMVTLSSTLRRVVSGNLEIVRAIVANWERGDYSSSDWADPEIEFVYADGPVPGSFRGVEGMAESWREFLRNWDDARAEVEELRELDGQRVLMLFRQQGRGRTSGLEVAHTGSRAANLFHLRDGRVTRVVLYLDRDRALADLGLEG